MRFMMLMIPGVYQGEGGKDFSPSAESFAEMNKYNEELAKAGVLVALEGLQPLTPGSQITFSGGKGTVSDRPITEGKEVLGGYWVIKVNSKEEAIEWAKRVPAEGGDMIEVRQIAEMEDFPEEVQKAGESQAVREAVGRS